MIASGAYLQQRVYSLITGEHSISSVTSLGGTWHWVVAMVWMILTDSSGGGGAAGSMTSYSNAQARFLLTAGSFFFVFALVAAAWSLKPTLRPASLLLRLTS